MKKTAKSHVVGKHPAHAKQTSPSAAHLQGEINSLKRSVAALTKHHAPPKKHHAKPKKHKKPAAKKRGLAIGDMAACCAAEALAASLRLSGRPVADEDVLALYCATAADLDAGVSIGETLEAAWLYGLGGVRPASLDQISLPAGQLHAALSELDDLASGWLDAPGVRLPFVPVRQRDWLAVMGGEVIGGVIDPAHGLILGLELPGPHTVLATPEGWWSWGELHDPSEFPDAVIEEAWAVSWH